MQKNQKLIRNLQKIQNLNQKINYFDTHVHFRLPKDIQINEAKYLQKWERYYFNNRIWSRDEIQNIKLKQPEKLGFQDSLAKIIAKSLIKGQNLLTGFISSSPSEQTWYRKLTQQEKLLGVPGFIAQVNGHIRALALTGIDKGLIYQLQEEAENQRVHLITYLDIQNPSQFFRTRLILSSSLQGFMFLFINFLIPKFGHKVAANLYEQGIQNYSQLLVQINTQNSPVSHWKTQEAPQIARMYYNLGEKGTMEDLVYCIRKDQEFFANFNQFLGENFTSSMNGEQVKKLNDLLPKFTPNYPEEYLKQQQKQQ